MIESRSSLLLLVFSDLNSSIFQKILVQGSKAQRKFGDVVPEQFHEIIVTKKDLKQIKEHERIMMITFEILVTFCYLETLRR